MGGQNIRLRVFAVLVSLALAAPAMAQGTTPVSTSAALSRIHIGNFGKETSVIVDYPFITGRSTPDSYLTGEKLVEVLENGLRQWGFHAVSD